MNSSHSTKSSSSSSSPMTLLQALVLPLVDKTWKSAYAG